MSDIIKARQALYGPGLIHVQVFLEKQAAASMLVKLWLARKPGPLAEAFFQGHVCTADVAAEQVRWAKDCGLLLLCWPGTRVLGAAA